MEFPRNPQPMTALKPTKDFMQECMVTLQKPEIVPDNDPIYDGYIVVLSEDEMTIAPNDEEFFSVFEFVNGETPGQFSPIKRKD